MTSARTVTRDVIRRRFILLYLGGWKCWYSKITKAPQRNKDSRIACSALELGTTKDPEILFTLEQSPKSRLTSGAKYATLEQSTG
jgi:hypothetical protein